MIKYTGQAFLGVIKVLRENFSSFFFERSITLPPVVGTLSDFTVNNYGLGLQNPMSSAVYKYTSFLRASYKLTYAALSEEKFSSAHHIWAVKEER